MTENELSYKIIGAAIGVHKALGPGLLESVYERALEYDLIEAGLTVESQVCIPFHYKKIKLPSAFRADLIVNDLVLIELKSVEQLAPVHFTRTLTYLRLSKKKLALLINFNVKALKEGIHRIVNDL
jgi:GxxExxY protein